MSAPGEGLTLADVRAGYGETIVIDGDFVEKHIGDLAKNRDLSRFIL